jgi:hypothetical protein
LGQNCLLGFVLTALVLLHDDWGLCMSIQKNAHEPATPRPLSVSGSFEYTTSSLCLNKLRMLSHRASFKWVSPTIRTPTFCSRIHLFCGCWGIWSCCGLKNDVLSRLSIQHKLADSFCRINKTILLNILSKKNASYSAFIAVKIGV